MKECKSLNNAKTQNIVSKIMSTYWQIFFDKIYCTWNFEKSNWRYLFCNGWCKLKYDLRKKNQVRKSALHKQQIQLMTYLWSPIAKIMVKLVLNLFLVHIQFMFMLIFKRSYTYQFLPPAIIAIVLVFKIILCFLFVLKSSTILKSKRK